MRADTDVHRNGAEAVVCKRQSCTVLCSETSEETKKEEKRRFSRFFFEKYSRLSSKEKERTKEMEKVVGIERKVRNRGPSTRHYIHCFTPSSGVVVVWCPVQTQRKEHDAI